MKQHITVEQFNELTIPQQVHFVELIYSDVLFENFISEDYFESNFTIGRMIEILRKQVSGYVNILFTPCGYQICMYNCDKESVYLMEKVKTNSTDICDALWQAVKEVL